MTKKSKAVPVTDITTDGIVNVLTGLGDVAKDKRQSATVEVKLMSYNSLAALYRTQPVAARIVDLPAHDMFREGFEASVSGDEEAADELDEMCDELCVEKAMVDAVRYRGAYGGAAILIGVNDGQADLSKPLNEEAIKSIDYLTVFDAFEAQIKAAQHQQGRYRPGDEAADGQRRRYQDQLVLQRTDGHRPDHRQLAFGTHAGHLLCIQRQIVAEDAGGFLGGNLGHQGNVVEDRGNVVDQGKQAGSGHGGVQLSE